MFDDLNLDPANLIKALDPIIDKATADPDTRAKIKMTILDEAASITRAMGQTVTNQDEAGNSNVFVSGWRPYVGWVCGIVFSLQFLFFPLAVFFGAMYNHPVPLPVFPDSMHILIGMLGFGGLRTIEKIQGVNNVH